MKKIKRNRVAYIFWGFLWTVPVVIIFFLLFLGYVKNKEISSITLHGNVSLSLNDIKKYVGITFPINYLDVHTSAIEKKLTKHPLIYSTDVKKNFNGELIITVTRSMPLVAILGTVNGVSTPVYFDKNGKCVQVGVKGGIVDVPIISGIDLIDPKLGVYVPNWLQDFFTNLATIKKENRKLFHSVSEFKLVSNQDNYKTLEIWFTKFKQKYIISMNIDTKYLERVWIFADRINKETFSYEFDSFDIRQGVIIGKKRESNEKNT